MMDIMKIGKPWGYELLLGEWHGWRLKILHINKGCRLSKQYHKEKIEYMFHLNDGTWECMPPFKVHRPEAKDEAIDILETSKGSDEDLVRLEDDDGRV